MAREDIAKVRGLAGELGYRLEPLPIRRCWQLIAEETGDAAQRTDGATCRELALNIVCGTQKKG